MLKSPSSRRIYIFQLLAIQSSPLDTAPSRSFVHQPPRRQPSDHQLLQHGLEKIIVQAGLVIEGNDHSTFDEREVKRRRLTRTESCGVLRLKVDSEDP
jgi:hypothetical protein